MCTSRGEGAEGEPNHEDGIDSMMHGRSPLQRLPATNVLKPTMLPPPAPFLCSNIYTRSLFSKVRREEVGISATQAVVKQARDDLRAANDEVSRVATLKTDLARYVCRSSETHGRRGPALRAAPFRGESTLGCHVIFRVVFGWEKYAIWAWKPTNVLKHSRPTNARNNRL